MIITPEKKGLQTIFVRDPAKACYAIDYRFTNIIFTFEVFVRYEEINSCFVTEQPLLNSVFSQFNLTKTDLTIQNSHDIHDVRTYIYLTSCLSSHMPIYIEMSSQ